MDVARMNVEVIRGDGCGEEARVRRVPTEEACSMAVPAMSTRPRTSALRMAFTHPTIRNANHREKYRRQLSPNGPFIFEG